eukprot:CAMPEP_0204864248 /NCGR_PEP_ID=MMETSP1348-20121228/3922_1 /ASSEMBLY_ACC=CAM_ASM_000700 /TAXON_ID=215587 /ORGANISM="Aplanochytrium stocchinoi, Strain GSBS06" /LENGTH=508 /DNA_ID=CAMNT_0052014821 /DNA_START=57 /DNA_END=1583 /DNA_ORIENTATION=-
MELQLKRELKNLRAKPDNLEKYVYLMEILGRNETLFYRLVVENIKECMPLVYTPTVGEACQKYSHIWSKPRGIYISIKDRGNVRKILQNWHTKDVKAIVFTDGERILGLGDLGVNGMGIPVGKLQLYSACAGIPPSQCLPVVIDNGTNTEEYLKDELYMGLKQSRVRGKEFEDLIEEFMIAATKTFGPSVLLQFEDFGNSTAFGLLEKTRKRFNTFNDDIQGTACVALGGILASLKIEGAPSKLIDHRIVFLGAGEAGIGIGELIAYAIHERDGISVSEARKNIWYLDSQGLITEARDKAEKLPHHKHRFAHDASAFKGPLSSLEDAVRQIKPTMIIGVSAQPGTFTKQVCKLMAENNKVPIIFALSNPTHKCECSAQEAYDWTKGKCVFASGSPFGTITSHGRTFEPGQGNNAYIFPGLALGVIAAEAKRIPESLFYDTAVCLAEQVTDKDYLRGSLYPKLEKIREVSLNIAVGVADSCFKLNIARVKEQPKDTRKWIQSKMTDFKY